MLILLTSALQEHGVKRPVDDALIIKIANGDTEALRTLYNSISGNVYGFALSVTKNPHDADDVLQETFLKVFSGAKGYRPCGKPMAWVLTIARNLAYSRLRERERSGELNQDVLADGLFLQICDLENKMLVEALFKHLADDEKQIIILHAINGMKHREIADVLELSLGTVLSKYSRAVSKLKKIAKKEDA